MNNTNGQEYRSKFKKAISSVNQALTLHYALEGLSARDYSSETDLVKNVFEKRMNVIEPPKQNSKQSQKRELPAYELPP